MAGQGSEFKLPYIEPPKETPHKVHAISVLQMALGAFVVSALILFGASYLGYQKLVSYNETTQLEAQRGVVVQLAARLGGTATGWVDMVTQIAASPALRDALQADDQAEVERLLQGVSALLPGALRLQVVSPEQINPDEKSEPPLSFACLDLVRLAESGENTQVEMHHYDNAPGHIDLVSPIRSGEGEPLLGTLLLSLDQATLQQWLEGIFTGDGYMEVRQRLGGGRFATLASTGDASLKGSLSVTSAEVNGTAWRLEVWRSGAALKRELPSDGYYLVFLIALVPLVLLFVLYAKVMRRVLHDDMMRLVRLTIKVGYGEKHDFKGFYLREFAASAKSLLEHLEDFPSRRSGNDRNAMTERQAWEQEQNSKTKKRRLPGL